MLFLTLGIGTANAEINYQGKGMAPNGQYGLSAITPNLSIDRALIGTEGINHFREILQTGSFYAFLVMLQSSTPEIANTGEFITLFIEVHQMNKNLMAAVEEMRKTNALLLQGLGNSVSDGYEVINSAKTKQTKIENGA